jgi:glucose-6-phosphate isomerase
MNNLLPAFSSRIKKIHFIGIGGSGMSGIFLTNRTGNHDSISIFYIVLIFPNQPTKIDHTAKKIKKSFFMLLLQKMCYFVIFEGNSKLSTKKLIKKSNAKY